MSKFPTNENNKEPLGGLQLLVFVLVCLAIAIVMLMNFLVGSMASGTGIKNIKIYQPGPARKIRSPEFSADASQFVVTVCGPCKIGIYTIDTESMVYLTPPKDSEAFDATFDTQSKTIAFILKTQVAFDTHEYQLAVSQIDGTGLKVLTASDTKKRFPAYAFDGGKIIFSGKERCSGTPTSYCREDIYEYDLQTGKERRITNLQAFQIGPAHFLPGNTKIVSPIHGSINTDGLRSPVEAKYGSDRLVFEIDAKKPAHFEQLDLDTPTASKPKPLSSGGIAFIFRDVFLWSNGATRRLTQFNRYIHDYAISNSAQSVLLLTEEQQDVSKCEHALHLWQVADQSSRELKCDVSAQERPLVP